ncbi:hypothetical protein B0H67DRAFT_638195 [Lasiosphaeris hirsuta]|uniref:Uncharacterized protein n=1 Tax=Lasiosphaeris hirsuta TaxID=260670 RepID=A0AA40B8J3_9PEZI|nr:hypothetical protein B0H67DRAFT_638195 [Lasiosphaeris hirsuta]
MTTPNLEGGKRTKVVGNGILDQIPNDHREEEAESEDDDICWQCDGTYRESENGECACWYYPGDIEVAKGHILRDDCGDMNCRETCRNMPDAFIYPCCKEDGPKGCTWGKHKPNLAERKQRAIRAELSKPSAKLTTANLANFIASTNSLAP